MDISQPEPNNGWTRVSYKRRRPAQEEYQGDVKHTTGSIQLPQLYWMRKTDTNNSKTDLGTHQNLHQYM
jgi:hypothetical protein